MYMTKKMTIEHLAAMIQNTMASKDDLKGMASKEDLKGMASKEDLKKMASKEDLKLLATKTDLRILDQKVEAGFQHVNARLDTIRDDISDLPVMRQELRDLRHRVDRLEQKVK